MVTVVFKRNIHGSAEKQGGGERRSYSTHPHPFLQQASGQVFKDDVNGFSSTSDICFMICPCPYSRPTAYLMVIGLLGRYKLCMLV